MNLIWLARARQELRRILAYIELRSPSVATKGENRIRSAVEHFTQFPRSKSSSPNMRQALRDWELAEARRAAELQALRADVQVGLNQIAAGKAKPFNVAKVVKAGGRLLAKKR